MKYITEYDLRVRFQQQPFTEYQLKEGTRLTPGAKQFLSDQRIGILEESGNEKIDNEKLPETSSHEKDTGSDFESIITDIENLERRILNQAKLSIGEDMELTLQLIDITAAISKIMGQMMQISHEYSGGKECRQKK